MSPIPRAEYCSRMGDEIRSGAFWRDILAELVASFLLAAAVLRLTHTPDPTTGGTLGIGLGVAFAWAAVGYGLEDFGRAHMSSAVTMALLVRAEVTILRALMYWIMQAAASIGAAFFVRAVTEADVTPFELQIAEDNDIWWRVMVMEVFITFILCSAALASLDVARKGYVVLQSLPVGMAAGLGMLLAFQQSGASMNPTLNMGRLLVYWIMQDGSPADWDYHWVFWAGPMIGAILAAILYWILDRAASPDVAAIYNNSIMTYNARPARRSTSKERLNQPADAMIWPAF